MSSAYLASMHDFDEDQQEEQVHGELFLNTSEQLIFTRCYHCGLNDREEVLLLCDNLQCHLGAHFDCVGLSCVPVRQNIVYGPAPS